MVPRRRAAIVAALAIGLLLSGAIPALAADAPALPGSASRVLIGGETGPSVPARGSPALAPATPVALTLTLAPRHPAELAALLHALATTPDPSGRAFLTPAEYRAEFGPTPSEVSAASRFLEGYGARDLQVTPDGFGVSAVLSAREAGAAFQVGLVTLDGPGEPGGTYAAAGVPSVPRALAGIVAGVDGLTNAAAGRYAPELRPLAGPLSAPPHGSVPRFVRDLTDGTTWYVGSDFAQAYGLPGLFPPTSTVPNATYPTGEAVATLLMSAYNQTYGLDLPPFDPAVVRSYFNDTLPASWPPPSVTGVPVTIDGVTPPPPGDFGALNDSTLDESENSLDLEMAGSLAPGATLVNFYFAGSLSAGPQATASTQTLAGYFAQTLAAALAYNYSPARLTAVSASFGLPDLNDTLWNAELAEAAATGVTVVAASGDQGNAPNDVSGRFQGPWPTWPASAAFDGAGSVSAGGVSVQLGGNATSTWTVGQPLNATFDPDVRGITAQSAWYDTSGGYGNVSGTEGGISLVYPEPAWQFVSAAQPAIVNATLDQGAGALGRAAPDLAMPANDTIAYVARDASGTYFEPLAGTSIAAPLFAGLVASVAADAGHPLGFLDPALYRIAGYFEAHPSPSDPFADVVSGHNFVFAAAAGWDATTGWGTVNATLLLEALDTPGIAGYIYTGPTPGLPGLPLPLAPPTALGVSVLVIVGIALAAAIAVVIVVARPRPASGVPPAPMTAGVWAPPPPPYPGAPPPPPVPAGPVPGWPPPYGPMPPPPAATMRFPCPYCGAIRPAEPVRCPGCGRY